MAASTAGFGGSGAGLARPTKAEALKAGTLQAASALGFIGAVGGYLVPRVFGAWIAATGGPRLALWVYLTFYAVCIAMTWWCFLHSAKWRPPPKLA